MVRAYIGLGANLGKPLQQLEQAVQQIAQLPNSQWFARSHWYSSTAIGPEGQPDYINGVCALDTQLSPIELLDALQAIENQLGRVRLERWGPRTLDLDILLYGEQVIDLPRLQIPHIEMHNRNFVLQPLAELYPKAKLPNGKNLAELVTLLGARGLRRLEPEEGMDG